MEATKKAIKIIDFENSKLVLNPEGLSFLRSLSEEVIIVTIVGKARTGKSYLMNLLLEEKGVSI